MQMYGNFVGFPWKQCIDIMTPEFCKDFSQQFVLLKGKWWYIEF